jgi:hypothetical protein
MNDYIGVLLTGLAGSPKLISATILALARVTHEFRGTGMKLYCNKNIANYVRHKW